MKSYFNSSLFSFFLFSGSQFCSIQALIFGVFSIRNGNCARMVRDKAQWTSILPLWSMILSFDLSWLTKVGSVINTFFDQTFPFPLTPFDPSLLFRCLTLDLRVVVSSSFFQYWKISHIAQSWGFVQALIPKHTDCIPFDPLLHTSHCIRISFNFPQFFSRIVG